MAAALPGLTPVFQAARRRKGKGITSLFCCCCQENKLFQKPRLADSAYHRRSAWCHLLTLRWKVAIEKGAVDGDEKQQLKKQGNVTLKDECSVYMYGMLLGMGIKRKRGHLSRS